MKDKILQFDDMARKVQRLRKDGKSVVLSIGVYDLIHPGIINHLSEAKSQGDVLVVGVLKDKDAKIGPGRPVFTEDLRARNVAYIEPVDYVCLVDNEEPFEAVRALKPDIFTKGKADREHDMLVFGKDMLENGGGLFGDSRVYETGGFSFSSSQVINKLMDLYPEGTKEFLDRFSQKYSFKQIAEMVNGLGDMNVLIIGDAIIDEYHYCESMNRSAKTPLVVNRYLYHEEYLGGVLAIANHVAGLCRHVHIVSLLGKEASREDFIRGGLRPNVDSKFFYRDDGPTIVKKRYINELLNWKLFEVNYINNSLVKEDISAQAIDYLMSVLPEYDLVLVSDYGHSFINEDIMRVLEEHSKILAINTQTNAANAGYNMITKYRKSHYVCLDEAEVRLASQDRFSDIEKITREMREAVNTDYFMVTRGRNGSIGVSSDEINRTPIFSTKVVDTIGAGDAFFAFTAPCFAKGMPLDLVSFIGNAVGALAVQIVGNKRPVERHEMLEFINTLLK